MLISYKHKYIYIDIPKTGCTAIQSYLTKHDDSCNRWAVEVEGEQILVDSHTETKEIKKIMGGDFADYTVFTFIREPYSRGVSTYFFYKTLKRKKSSSKIRNIFAQLNAVITKILPFSIWSVLKPQKKLTSYFYDEEGNLLIDLVGKTENLNEDLWEICNKIGISLNNISVPVKNKSKHSFTRKYYSNGIHTSLYEYLLKEDIELYKKYSDTIYTEKFEEKADKVL